MDRFVRTLRIIGLVTSTFGLLAVTSPSGYAVKSPLGANQDVGEDEIAQTPNSSPFPDQPRVPTLPEMTPEPTLPPPEDLLEFPDPVDVPDEAELPAEIAAETICVADFRVIGNVTAFSPEELADQAWRAVGVSIENEDTNADAQPLSPPESCYSTESGEYVPGGYRLTLADLFRARAAITDLYVKEGYATSGAFIPEQTLAEGIVEIQVVEGGLEDINVSGNRRLTDDYVRSRIALSTAPPLNRDTLLDGLRLLQQDPLIDSVSAELSTGTRTGSNVLDITIQEADPFETAFVLNNDRAIAIGAFSRGVALTHQNLFGIGDNLNVGYRNTDGSDTVNASYSLPINPREGRLRLSYETAWNSIIDSEFEALGIQSESESYEVFLRQPIYRTPSQELALGIGATFRESQLTFDFLGERLPLSTLGSDPEGRTKVFALRFTQEWTLRGSRQVIAARSQFSLGLDALDSTINPSGPDSEFFSWLGQGQWIYLLDRDMPFVLRGSAQLADRTLVPAEQIAIGGRQTVRGYRQNALSTDNGATATAELRLPIYRASNIQGVLQLVPFIDFGTGWNNNQVPPSENVLVGLGAGLLWQQGSHLSARLDYGVPLISVTDVDGNSLQDNGIYFSVVLTPW